MITGLLLAAGAGTRMGRPKALVADERGGWLVRAVRCLADGGCDDVVVVLGAAADDARALLAAEPGLPAHRVVVADDWAEGMGASLRVGLRALADADAAVVHLVDLPDLGPDVVGRVAAGAGPATLRRAVFDGVPGHPVVLGRAHWDGVRAAAAGDAGARGYLAARPAGEVELVECGDLGGGDDQDTPTR